MDSAEAGGARNPAGDQVQRQTPVGEDPGNLRISNVGKKGKEKRLSYCLSEVTGESKEENMINLGFLGMQLGLGCEKGHHYI